MKIQDGRCPLYCKSLNISTKSYPILMKFNIQQHIWNLVTARWPNVNIFVNSRWRTSAVLKVVFWP